MSERVQQEARLLNEFRHGYILVLFVFFLAALENDNYKESKFVPPDF